MGKLHANLFDSTIWAALCQGLRNASLPKETLETKSLP